MHKNPTALSRSNPTLSRLASLLALTAALFPGAAPAANTNLYWDANGSSGTTGGSGNWETTALLWRNGSATGALQAYTNTSPSTITAQLSGTAGTLTIASGVTINVNNVTFSTGGYTLASADATAILNLSGTAPEIDNANGVGAQTISAKITGAAGFTRGAGDDFMVFTGDLSGLSGTINVNGRINLDGTKATGSQNQTWNIGAGQVLSSQNIGTASTIQLGALSGAGTLRSGNLGGAQNGAGTDIFQVGALNTNTTYSGVIADFNPAFTGLTKVGSGTLILTGDSTYTGATTVNGGTLVVGAGGSLYTGGNTAGSLVVNSGATVRFDQDDSLGNSGVITNVVVTVNGGTLASNNSYTSLSNPVLNGATLNGNGASNATFPAFSLRGTVKVGGAQVTNINAVSGVNNNVALGTYNISDAVTFNVADATGTALSDLNVNTFFTNQGTNNGLIKTGAGTMTLAGANTYTGATAVNGGALLVTGSTASASAVTVSNAGTTLGGVGTVSGTVTVGNGAVISAGNKGAATPANGTLTTGALTLQAGSAFNALLTSSASFSKLTAGGTTNLGNAAFSISLTPGATFANNTVLTLITSPVSNQFTNATFTTGGYLFTANYTTDAGKFDVTITTAVPEPATWVAGALALTLAGAAWRRSRNN